MAKSKKIAKLKKIAEKTVVSMKIPARIIRKIFRKEFIDSTITDGIGKNATIYYKRKNVQKFVENKQISATLASYDTIDRPGGLYITESSLMNFLCHIDRRRCLKEIKAHVASSLCSIEEYDVKIGGEIISLPFIIADDIEYSKEGMFIFQVAYVLKNMFNYKDEDMIEQASPPIKNIKRRIDFLIPEIKLCIEFDETNHGAQKIADKEREDLLLTHQYTVIRHAEGADPIKFFNDLYDMVVKRKRWYETFKNNGEISIKMRREILYDEYTRRGKMDKEVTKMMIQFVGLKQTVPSIPFGKALKIINHRMSMKSFGEKMIILEDNPELVDHEKSLLSPSGFGIMASRINIKVCVWYTKMHEFCEQLVTEMYRTQFRDTINLYDAIKATVNKTLINTETIAHIAKEREVKIYKKVNSNLKIDNVALKEDNRYLKEENDFLKQKYGHVEEEEIIIEENPLNCVDNLKEGHIILSDDEVELVYMSKKISLRTDVIRLYKKVFGTDYSDDNINKAFVIITKTCNNSCWKSNYRKLHIRKKVIKVKDVDERVNSYSKCDPGLMIDEINNGDL
jgi:hypothetical protein